MFIFKTGCKYPQEQLMCEDHIKDESPHKGKPGPTLYSPVLAPRQCPVLESIGKSARRQNKARMIAELVLPELTDNM